MAEGKFREGLTHRLMSSPSSYAVERRRTNLVQNLNTYHQKLNQEYGRSLKVQP